jgi:predicted nuclease with TOPRIM domain
MPFKNLNQEKFFKEIPKVISWLGYFEVIIGGYDYKTDYKTSLSLEIDFLKDFSEESPQYTYKYKDLSNNTRTLIADLLEECCKDKDGNFLATEDILLKIDEKKSQLNDLINDKKKYKKFFRELNNSYEKQKTETDEFTKIFNCFTENDINKANKLAETLKNYISTEGFYTDQKFNTIEYYNITNKLRDNTSHTP